MQKSPILVQQENVLKEETPSEARDRQSPNFVQRDIRLSDLESRVVLHRSAPAAVRADPENVPDDRAPYCAPEF